MTFNWSKEEVTSLALKSPKATVLSDAVEWVLSLESLYSLEMSVSLAASAVGGVMSVSAIECKIINARHTVGNLDGCQTSAIRERFFSNARHAISDTFIID